MSVIPDLKFSQAFAAFKGKNPIRFNNVLTGCNLGVLLFELCFQVVVKVVESHVDLLEVLESEYDPVIVHVFPLIYWFIWKVDIAVISYTVSRWSYLSYESACLIGKCFSRVTLSTSYKQTNSMFIKIIMKRPSLNSKPGRFLLHDIFVVSEIRGLDIFQGQMLTILNDYFWIWSPSNVINKEYNY